MTHPNEPGFGPDPTGSSSGDSTHTATLAERRRAVRSHKAKRDLKRLAWILLGLVALIAFLVFFAKRDDVEPLVSKPITPPAATQMAPEKVTPAEAKPAKAEPEAKPEGTYYTFRDGDRMFQLFGKSGALKVQQANPELIKDINRIRKGDTVLVPADVKIHKMPAFRIVDCSRTRKGFCEYRNPGGDKMCGVRSHEKALTSPQEYGLTAEQAATVMGDKGERVLLPSGTRLSALSFGHGHWQGPVVLMKDMLAHRKAVIGGKTYLEFDACCNLATMEVPPEPVPLEPEPIPEPPPAPVEEPPPVIPEPPQEPKEPEEGPPPVPPLSAFPVENELEWEAIVGAGVWNNGLANGKWWYGEGLLSVKLGDGYSLGIGPFYAAGKGESETSAYTWRESTGWGPQIGLKRNYRAEQTDEFGQTVLLPAGWQVKARFLSHDKVSGGNPESGYHNTQWGKKIGVYGEYFERKSLDWLYGVSGEIWHYYDGRIRSTWSGDKPQDRGSWNANVYAQYRINDDWQARGIAGVAHQNWDRLNYLNLTAEMRYRETLMFGPRLSLALNKPDTYRDIGRGELTTLGAFVRLELGGIIRQKDREVREESVVFVGPTTDPVDEGAVAPAPMSASPEAEGGYLPVAYEAPPVGAEQAVVPATENPEVTSSWGPSSDSGP